MRTARLVALAASVAALVIATGCGSSASSTATASTAADSLELSGSYVPSSAGAIAAIDFVDATREEITWTSCSGGASCTRAGTYTVSSDATQLRLTDAVSGDVTTLSFSALTRSTGGLAVQDLVQAATGDGGLVGNGAPLVTSFSAQDQGSAPQTFENDPTEPKANQANTPESPYDCSGGMCVYDDSSFWGQSENTEGDIYAQ